MMQNNIFSSINNLKNLKNLIFLGSSCVYPTNYDSAMSEEMIMMGTPENTNIPYAISKIAGIISCKSYNQQYKALYVMAL